MIEVHDRLNPRLLDSARDFVAEHEKHAGHYGDSDPAWLCILHRSLGHTPLLLLSRNLHGAIDGYLPLASVRSALFGKFLVSMPYVTHAGIIAEGSAAAAALRDRAIELADKLDVDRLELRNSQPSGDQRFGHARTDKVRITRAIPADTDRLWQQLGAKTRNQIRKGARYSFELRFGRHELLDGFYDVFSENMRDLGVPVYPRSFFSAVLDCLPEQAELAVVKRAGSTSAAALLVHGSRGQRGCATSSVPAASARRSERSSNVNTWMYHQLLLRAIQRGAGEFDFGRSSRDSGPYRFKRHWGCDELSTCWESYVRRGDPAALKQDHPRYARRIAVWKRLPIRLTRILGPRIVRGIP